MPLAILEDLKAADLVLFQNGKDGAVGVHLHVACTVGIGAQWVPVDSNDPRGLVKIGRTLLGILTQVLRHGSEERGGDSRQVASIFLQEKPCVAWGTWKKSYNIQKERGRRVWLMMRGT